MVSGDRRKEPTKKEGDDERRRRRRGRHRLGKRAALYPILPTPFSSRPRPQQFHMAADALPWMRRRHRLPPLKLCSLAETDGSALVSETCYAIDVRYRPSGPASGGSPSACQALNVCRAVRRGAQCKQVGRREASKIGDIGHIRRSPS